MERRWVVTYGTVGRLIEGFLGSGTVAAPGIHQQLATDLDIDQHTLYQASQFYRAYPRLDFERQIIT